VKTHDRIRSRNPDYGARDRLRRSRTRKSSSPRWAACSSAKSGRRNWALQQGRRQEELGDLIWRCYKICGHEKTVIVLDKLKALGFREATRPAAPSVLTT
jgi:DNA-directed RNA polymerase subunit beta'